MRTKAIIIISLFILILIVLATAGIISIPQVIIIIIVAPFILIFWSYAGASIYNLTHKKPGAIDEAVGGLFYWGVLFLLISPKFFMAFG